MLLSAISDEIGNDIDDMIDSLKEVNFEYIELRKINDRYLFELSDEELYIIKEKLDLNKISISLIDSPIGKNKFSYEEEKKLFLRYLYICQILKCNKLRIFSDIKDINVFSKIAKRNCIVLLLENEPGTLAQSSDSILQILKETNNIEVLFDIENFNKCGENYMDSFNKLKPYIKYIHIRNIKNNKYCYLDEGELNLEFLKEINGIFFSIESHLPMVSNDSKKNLFVNFMRRFKI